MAEASQTQVIEGLNRAAAEPGGLALFAGKGAAGLFPNSAAGRQAAQHCKDQGLLRVVRTEPRGKTQVEFCTITDNGMSFLLDNMNPRGVLEAMLHALDARRADQAELLERTKRTQDALAAMQTNLSRVLAKWEVADRKTAFQGGPAYESHAHAAPLREIHAGIVEHLERWRDSGSLDDCPLPELFQRLEKTVPGLTIGLFHDALRELHEQGRVFLHPWTGPLYELPEPAMALLAGHEIGYYASLRHCETACQFAGTEASVGA